jgi:hypothetical protein
MTAVRIALGRETVAKVAPTRARSLRGLDVRQGAAEQHADGIQFDGIPASGRTVGTVATPDGIVLGR